MALDTSKPTAIYTPTGRPRLYTVSIAVPGSVVANALTHDAKTALAGQIARAAAVCCIDEVVVFDDGNCQTSRERHREFSERRRDSDQQYRYAQHNQNGQDTYSDDTKNPTSNEDDKADVNEHTGWSNPTYFLFHLLSYLECPPYLRRALFPLHPNLRTAGSLPSLDMPHHVRSDEWIEYREGVTVDPETWHTNESFNRFSNNHKRRKTSHQKDSIVDAGLKQTFILSGLSIPPKTRVTLKVASSISRSISMPLEAEAVSPNAPREESGYYWGYSTRMANNLSSVFTEVTFEGGYDFCIGTSERGQSLSEFLKQSLPSRKKKSSKLKAAGVEDNADAISSDKDSGAVTYRHLLVVFGGPTGIESAINNDKELTMKGINGDNASDLFDAWVNAYPGQGSRTIRTEEALWVALTGLKEFIDICGR
jgi:methyltransferase